MLTLSAFLPFEATLATNLHKKSNVSTKYGTKSCQSLFSSSLSAGVVVLVTTEHVQFNGLIKSAVKELSSRRSATDKRMRSVTTSGALRAATFTSRAQKWIKIITKGSQKHKQQSSKQDLCTMPLFQPSCKSHCCRLTTLILKA